MSIDYKELAAPGVRGLQPYQPGKPISEIEREYGVTGIVKLASNENPLGPGPKALAALEAEVSQLGFYPDGGGFELKQAIATHHDVAPSQVTLGNGSNDVLVLLAETFLTPEYEAVYSQFGFAVYMLAVQAVGATARIAKAHPAGHASMPLGHDLGAMAALVGDATRLVFIANPNNPTGTWVPADALEDFVRALPPQVVVVIDQAYFEYVEETAYPDAVHWIARYPNLVVTHTFSKAHGLAGLRVGYSLSHPEIAELLNRVRQPFNVNTLALTAASASLGDREHIRRSCATNTDGMRRVEAALRRLGLSWVPSVANFLLVDFGRPVQPIFEALLHEALIVRPVANYGLPNHLRITIGTAAENERLIQALDKVMGTA